MAQNNLCGMKGCGAAVVQGSEYCEVHRRKCKVNFAGGDEDAWNHAERRTVVLRGFRDGRQQQAEILEGLTMAKIRAISLWQPWATLVVFGYKQLETRHWSTNYTGPLAIHAAKKKSRDIERLCEFDDPIFLALQRAGYTYKTLPRGGIIGKVYMGNCVPVTDPIVRRRIDEKRDEYSFGDFGKGRFAWVLSVPSIIDPMVECVGRQGFFEWEDGLE